MKHISILILTCSILFQLSGQITITIQPDSEDGKDAQISDYFPNNNNGNSYEFEIYAWTYSGTPTLRRCFIDFDFSQIPPGAAILSAKLTLYNNANSTSTGGEHSQLSGTNKMIVQRVIDPWDEQAITWNNQPGVTLLNEVVVPASTSIHQDYEIDVKALVQDIINDPGNSYGFKLKLETEQHYRSLIFASSDISNANLHPKIEICYDNSTHSIASQKEEMNIAQVYPNPNQGLFNVDIIGVEKSATVIISDITGNEIIHKQVSGKQCNINLTNYPKGIYIVKTIAGKETFVEKVIYK